MKLIPTTIAALIFSATAMQAADSLKINTMEPQMEDIFSILNSMDMDFFRFGCTEVVLPALTPFLIMGSKCI